MRIGTAVLAFVLSACGSAVPATAPSSPATMTEASPTAASPGSASTAATAAPTPTPAHRHARPDWLGTRVIEAGVAQDTPPALVDRRLEPPRGGLPDPPDATFRSRISPVPDEVRDRSTWQTACPVDLSDLRYATVTFWGFDGQPHTGELLVHRRAAEDLVRVFERLYDAGFPIEEMRVVSPADLDAPPTGDGNNTSAFVCRPVTGGDGWSQHAYGLAVDVNPFHNPYHRDDVVLPELATAYLDRSRQAPGMLHSDGAVVAAFDAIAWGWGGRWDSLTDWQHFSASGT